MLIYEKDNKLNINFENSTEEQPDISIGKENGKTEIMVDGQKDSSLPDISQAEAGYVLKLVNVPEERVVSELKNLSGKSGDVLFAGFPTDEITSNAIHNWIESLSSEGIYPDNGSLTNIHSIEYIEAIGDIPHISVLTDWSGNKYYTKYEFYSDGRIQTQNRNGSTAMSFPIENLTFTIYGVFYKVVPQWAGETKN
jgi:hypothetical protein